MGLSCYFILLLFNKANNDKIILGIASIYFVIIDIDIFTYKKAGLIIGILIIRVIQLCLLLLLSKMNFNMFKVIVGIFLMIILMLWYFVVKELNLC